MTSHVSRAMCAHAIHHATFRLLNFIFFFFQFLRYCHPGLYKEGFREGKKVRMLHLFAILFMLLASGSASYLPSCTAGGVDFFVGTVERCLDLSAAIPSGDCNATNSQAVLDLIDNCLPKTVYNPTINLDLTLVYRNSSFPAIDRRLYENEVICALVRGTVVAPGATAEGPAIVVWDFVTGTDFNSPGPSSTGIFPIDGSFHSICHTYTEPGAHPVAIFAVDNDGRTSQVEAIVEIRDVLVV